MTGTTPSEAWLSSTRRRPSLAGNSGAATGMPLASSQVVRAAVSARRWNRFGETDDFAIRRLSPDVTHASRFPELMTRRSQSSTAIAHVSQRASPIQLTAEAAPANPKRSIRASSGSTDSHSMLRSGVAVTIESQPELSPSSPRSNYSTPLAHFAAAATALRNDHRGMSNPQIRNNWPNLACLNGRNVSLVTIATGRCRLYSPQVVRKKRLHRPVPRRPAVHCTSKHSNGGWNMAIRASRSR